MFKRVLISFFSLVVLLTTSFLAQAQFKKPKIGFLPGVVDPFYQVMEIGVKEAATDFGLEVVTHYPQTGDRLFRPRSWTRWSDAAT